VTFGALSVRDVVLKLTLTVADNEVLPTNTGLFDVPSECHDNCGVCFISLSVGRSEPPWCLALDKLRVVSGNTVRDFG